MPPARRLVFKELDLSDVAGLKTRSGGVYHPTVKTAVKPKRVDTLRTRSGGTYVSRAPPPARKEAKKPPTTDYARGFMDAALEMAKKKNARAAGGASEGKKKEQVATNRLLAKAALLVARSRSA